MLKYLKNFIRINPIKITYLVICVVSFFFAGRISDDTFTQEICGKEIIKTGQKTSYVFLYRTSSGIECLCFEKEPSVINNVLTYHKYSGVNILLWGLFAISLTLVIVSTLMWKEDEVSWEFNRTKIETYYDEITIYEQDGLFHWVLHGHLIYSNQHELDSSSIKWRVSDFLKNKNFYPKWTSKDDKREKILNKIGII